MAVPTKRQRRWQRLRRLGLWAVALFVLIVLLYPFWLAWLIKPVAAQFGVQIRHSTAHGYDRLSLEDIEWSNPAVTIRVGEFDLQAPHHLLLQRLRDTPTEDHPQLRLSQWQVETRPARGAQTASERSMVSVLGSLRAILPSWHRWLRYVEATHGTLRLGEKRINIDEVVWREGQLSVHTPDGNAAVQLDALSQGLATLTATHADLNVAIDLRAADGIWTFDGHLLWLSNRFGLRGRFERDGLLPSVAVAESQNLRLRPETFGLAGFDPLQGHARVAWTNDHYTFDAAVDGTSQDEGNWLPERIAVSVGGRGDLAALTLDRFVVESPFVNATLDEPLTVAYGGRLLGNKTRLRLQADLARIKAVPIQGALTGDVEVEPVVDAPLHAAFRLNSSALDGFGLQARTLRAEGVMVWPLLQVTNLTAQLEPEGKLTATLEMKLDDREVHSLDWTFEGPWPGQLPPGLSLAQLRGTGTASGPWPTLSHSGELDLASLEVAPFQAEHIRLAWQGHQGELTNIQLTAVNRDATIKLAGNGALSLGTNRLQAQLDCSALELTSPEGELQLKAPFTVAWTRAAEQQHWVVTPLALDGTLGLIHAEAGLEWPTQGALSLQVERLRSHALQPFLKPVLPEVTVSNLSLEGRWTNGPVSYTLAAVADLVVEQDMRWSAEIRADSDGERMDIADSHVGLNGARLVTLAGHWPLRFVPPNFPSLSTMTGDGPGCVTVDVDGDGPALDWLEQRTGVRLLQPTLQLLLTNHHGEISAQLLAEADRIALPQTNALTGLAAPAFTQVRLAARADAQTIVLESLNARILQQPLAVQARYAPGSTNWTEWWARIRNPDWQRLSGRLSVEHADLASLAVLAPDIVAPMGTVDLDLEVDPSLQVRGTLAVTNAATRALEPLGSLRDVRGSIAFDGWDVTVQQLEATLGGRPISLGGTLGWTPDGLKRMDLRVSGENLSLVHEPDLFVRADLDLRLQKTVAGTPALTGEVELRRSLLVRDFRSLVTLDRATPDRRPPWVNIPQEPFASWQVDVRMKGDRFLNVITPAFKGEVSAGLQLQGTLGEPFLVGAITVDSGKLLFPFGQVALERGRVDFSREDPFRPELEFRGEGLNFGYTVTVDLTGPLDAPNLTLQSVPPLTAQQILLMLSAGEIPRSDFDYTTSDKASRIGFFVGKEFVNRFIGNTAATERLTLRSGEYITEEGRTTYLLEYQLTDRLSIFGEYNRFQDFNSGLKMKVLAK